MHYFHTFNGTKSSTTPVLLCQECCTVKILCAYSVTLLAPFPLHGDSFPNILSSPLVAILPHLQTKTPASLKWFSFSKKHPSHTHTPASSLSAFPCYSATHRRSCILFQCPLWMLFFLFKKKAGERLQGHHTERWILINPMMSKSTSKAVWFTPLHTTEMPPFTNSNCKPMQLMTSARMANHGTNSKGGFLQ